MEGRVVQDVEVLHATASELNPADRDCRQANGPIMIEGVDGVTCLLGVMFPFLLRTIELAHGVRTLLQQGVKTSVEGCKVSSRSLLHHRETTVSLRRSFRIGAIFTDLADLRVQCRSGFVLIGRWRLSSQQSQVRVNE